MNTPSIDVVIPAWNAKQFIIATLDSVVAQTLLPQQIIVVDDGSTDTTSAVVTQYAKTAVVPIVIVQKENGGLSSARNAGIKKSTSPYIAFLDADDLWYPTKLEEQYKIFAATSLPTLGLVYCDYDLIDTAGNEDMISYKVPLDHAMHGQVFNKLLKAHKILSSGSGVLIKKEVFDTVGLFDESLLSIEDWDMWLRIAQQYDIDYANKVLVHIRRHPQSMTYDRAQVFLSELFFYNKWVPRLKEMHQPIPLLWRTKVSFKLLARLPKRDFGIAIKEKFSLKTYKVFFPFSFLPLYLYSVLIVLKSGCAALFSKEDFSRMARAVKGK